MRFSLLNPQGILLALFAILSFPVQSSETDGMQLLRFNVSPDGYPPYLIVKEDMPVRGIVWDAVRIIAERLDLTLEPQRIPRKRVDMMLLEGKLDATPRAPEWTAEPERFVFTDPLLYTEEVFFSPIEKPFRFGHDTLEGRTVLTHLGYRYPVLDSMMESGKIDRFDVANERMMFHHLLAADHFNLLIAERRVGLWIMKKEGVRDQIYVDSKPVSSVGYRIMLTPRHKHLVEPINREMRKLKESGELAEIIARYQ